MDRKSRITQPSVLEIIPGLFIGNEWSTYDEITLANNNITAVVSLVYARSMLWQRKQFTRHVKEENHLYIGCTDSSTQDLLKNLDTICDFIERMLQRPPKSSGNVLVHCTHGISRSAAAVIAYIMRKQKRDFASVLDEVRANRQRVRPSANFVAQLEVWEQLRYHIWEDEAKTVPKPAYGDFLARRLLLCKAKGLNGNEPDSPQSLEDLVPLPVDYCCFNNYRINSSQILIRYTLSLTGRRIGSELSLFPARPNPRGYPKPGLSHRQRREGWGARSRFHRTWHMFTSCALQRAQDRPLNHQPTSKPKRRRLNPFDKLLEAWNLRAGASIYTMTP